MSEEHHVEGVYQGSGVPHHGIEGLAPPRDEAERGDEGSGR